MRRLCKREGTNFCGDIKLHYEYGATGIPVTGPGRYVLSNGVLNVSGQTSCGGGGSFKQWGGLQTNAGIDLRVTMTAAMDRGWPG